MTALAVCNNVTPVEQGPHVDELGKGEEVDLRELGRRSSAQFERGNHARGGSIAGLMDRPEQEPQLEASSPDEVALVKFGYSVKMRLTERDRQTCSMQNICGDVETFDILASFPFTSESKKMGCLLKSRDTGRNIYFLKGAEMVMEHKIKVGAKASLLESCENLAMEGLRTLVFAQKVLTDEQVDQFLAHLKRAEARLRNREAHVARV